MSRLAQATCLYTLALCMGACAPAVHAVRQPAAPPRPFKAVLFPYIPDSANDQFASLIQTLTKNFKEQHPDIDLTIVMDQNMDLYDLSDGGTLNQLLGPAPAAAQVVEVDTLLLGSLVTKNWIGPVSMGNPGVLETAWNAATIDNTAYGIPTYLCSNVVYSRSAAIKAATGGSSLFSILTQMDPSKAPLVANYKGSWTLPGTYVDAWADTNPGALTPAYNLPVDPATMAVFKPIVSSCAKLSPTSTPSNPCLDGQLKKPGAAAQVFATQKANGFMGYTEELFNILSNSGPLPPLTAISAPLGVGTRPVIFVDALVFNSNCTGPCLADAQAFAAFMSDTRVRSLIAFSQDAPKVSIPRYLLQANKAFYEVQPAASDAMYQQFLPIVHSAQPFPNQGFPEHKTALGDAVQQALTPSSVSFLFPSGGPLTEGRTSRAGAAPEPAGNTPGSTRRSGPRTAGPHRSSAPSTLH
ncbi:conserved uncharacterized protein [Stigmatella aurantiaca DW4/3-1]|uniref:Conserved uncharacterized protein n=1 Tax=Stigmatella aurantiaca (strain DW4/3-1) TaxID=378806 RepID=Q091K4_STIAD|nr:conserved uncharacterized protein [Stigmatella aurantiaca DW4/3-1]EAU66385.1 hypothetical protein STIAU_8839 [Stigmatella aurantiaca DW4/3-1]